MLAKVKNVFSTSIEKVLGAIRPAPTPAYVEVKEKQFDERIAPFAEYVAHYDYPVEKHTVTTTDGYILQVFRIQAKGQKSMQKNKRPVLLQHGVGNSSDIFVLNDEDKALGFMLANAGYDVWFGNSRGNKYSRQHERLNPDVDGEFWKFSFQHVAQYDLPAMCSYILLKTEEKSLDYIGHSQGAGAMIAALAEELISDTSIGKFFAVTPAVFLRHANWILRFKSFILNKFDIYRRCADRFKLHESEKYVAESRLKDAIKCQKSAWPYVLQRYMNSDKNWNILNRDRLPYFLGHSPAGTSTMSLCHFAQLTGDSEGRFRKFDHGEEKNYQIYKRSTPPEYDLSKVKHKVYVIGGTYDIMCHPNDVKRLAKTLPDAEYMEYEEGHMSVFQGIKTQHLHDIMKILASK